MKNFKIQNKAMSPKKTSEIYIKSEFKKTISVEDQSNFEESV